MGCRWSEVQILSPRPIFKGLHHADFPLCRICVGVVNPGRVFCIGLQVRCTEMCVLADHFNVFPSSHFHQGMEWRSGLNVSGSPSMPQVVKAKIGQPGSLDGIAPRLPR